jgi:hypothetical protein
VKKLNIVILLIFLSLSSLPAKENNKKLSKEELVKQILLLDLKEKEEKTKTKNMKIKTKIFEDELKEEKAKTKALKEIIQVLEKAKNQKTDK